MTCNDRGIVTKTDATRGRKKAVLICEKSFCCKQECAMTRKTRFSEKKGVLFRERSIYQRRRGCKDRVLGMKMQALFRKWFSRLRKNVFAFLRFHGRIPLLRHRNRMLWETEKKCNYSNIIRHQLCSSLGIGFAVAPDRNSINKCAHAHLLLSPSSFDFLDLKTM